MTLTEKLRSIAYFTSAEVTSRFTGGPKRTPFLMRTVTVLPSAEIFGIAAARSGTVLTEFAGVAYSVRWTAVRTCQPYE